MAATNSAFDLTAFAAELSLLHETEYDSKLFTVGKTLYETKVLPRIAADAERFREDARKGFAGRVVMTLTEPEVKALRVYFDREKITRLKFHADDLFLAWAADY